jgi:hypothetical protein
MRNITDECKVSRHRAAEEAGCCSWVPVQCRLPPIAAAVHPHMLVLWMQYATAVAAVEAAAAG